MNIIVIFSMTLFHLFYRMSIYLALYSNFISLSISSSCSYLLLSPPPSLPTAIEFFLCFTASFKFSNLCFFIESFTLSVKATNFAIFLNLDIFEVVWISYRCLQVMATRSEVVRSKMNR